jgi:diguanylate cyclase
MSRLRTFVHSLKFRLTLGAVAALAVGMGVVALLLVRQTERDTLVSQRQHQVGETVRTAQVLARRVVDLQRALEVTASQLDPQTFGDSRRLAEFIHSKPVLNAIFSSVFVVSPAGTIVLLQQGSLQSFPGSALGDRPYVRLTFEQKRPLVSAPMLSRVSGTPILAFTYPLMSDGKVYGLLAGTLALASRELVADLVDDDDSGSLLAVSDLKGKILAHPIAADVLGSIADQPRLGEAFAAWTAGGAAAEPSGLSLPQTDEVVTVCGVPGTDWMVWRAFPQRELLAPLRAARTNALQLVGALLLGMTLVVFALLAWLLRPLALLSTRAQRLFDSKLDPLEGWPDAQGELGHLTQVLRHVGSERAQLEVLNEQVLKKLGSVMSAAPIGIAFTREQRFELVSAELCRMLGRSESELLGQRVEIIYADHAHYSQTIEAMAPAFRSGVPYQGEWQMVRADGTAFCAQLRGRPVDGGAHGFGTIWTVSDVTEQVASRVRLEWSATHDALTGLANRDLLETRLAEVFQRRHSGLPSAVVAIDLDRFKLVNDAAGHAAGDAMLKAVAAAIGSRLRSADLVARTGGDEFAVVLDGCPSSTALRIADEVRLAIVSIALDWEGGHVLRVGASLGVAMLKPETESVAVWLGEADAACYEVKREGRGAVRENRGSRLSLV